MKKILICRTDHIGDVILTLPLAGIIKKNYPDAKIGFLVSAYTKDLVSSCSFIDEVHVWEEIKSNSILLQDKDHMNYDVAILVFSTKEIARKLKQLKIPIRIGSNRRWYNWFYCNRLVNIVRKKSPLHEAQLNLKFLKYFNVQSEYPLSQLHNYYGLDVTNMKLPDTIINTLNAKLFKIIIHPLSHGNTRHWHLENFKSLAQMLVMDQRFQIIITGSAKEKIILENWLSTLPDQILDLTGQLSLTEFTALIQRCDCMIANSTGPMHIAAALGKYTLGLFVPYYAMHPTRWAPLGSHAVYVMSEKSCNGCKNDIECTCMKTLEVSTVLSKLNESINPVIKT